MKTKTRLLALMLALLFICLPFASCKDDNGGGDTPGGTQGTDDEFTGSIAGDDVEGEGGNEDEAPVPPIAEGDENATVTISSYEDLKSKIAQKGTFVLQNDIVITATDFTPIGTYLYPFLGTFDGNGHKITVKINQSAEGIGFSPTFKFVYCGLFGVTRDATVKNLTLEVDINASSSTASCFVLAGGIAGYMINTEVKGCTVDGSILSKSEFFNSYAGNIAGVAQGGKITDCTANVSVKTHGSQNRAVSGGIVAYVLEGTEISYCDVNADVKAVSTKGVAYAGGLVGNAKHSSFTACSVNGSIDAEVSEYKATDKTHGVAFAGGLIGVASGDQNSKKASFTRCYALNGTVTAMGNNNTAYAAGIAATVSYASFVHCYSLCDVVLSTGTNLGYAASGFASLTSSGFEDKANDTYVADFIIDGCFSRGSVTATHKNPAYMFIGTTYGYIVSQSAIINIKNAVYDNSKSFTLNGGQTIFLSKNGTEKDTSFFTLDNYKSALGWSEEQWYVDNGIVKAK